LEAFAFTAEGITIPVAFVFGAYDFLVRTRFGVRANQLRVDVFIRLAQVVWCEGVGNVLPQETSERVNVFVWNVYHHFVFSFREIVATILL
jgi:hypothetical protein